MQKKLGYDHSGEGIPFSPEDKILVEGPKTKTAIASHSTIEERQAAVNFGRASVALEGFMISSEAQAQQHRWVRGEITMEECIAGIKQAHKKP